MPIEDGDFRLGLEHGPVGRFERDVGVVIEKRDLKHCSVHALIELQNRSVGILEQTSQDLSARLFAVCDRVSSIRRHDDLYAGAFELLHSLLQIVNPKSEMM